MRLPPHYVPRPRIVKQCADASVVVVEAAAGYGKSVLGAELAASWGAVPVPVLLEREAVPAPLLVARLRAAVAATGYTAAAAAAVESGEDAVGAVDAMVATLAGSRSRSSSTTRTRQPPMARHSSSAWLPRSRHRSTWSCWHDSSPSAPSASVAPSTSTSTPPISPSTQQRRSSSAAAALAST